MSKKIFVGVAWPYVNGDLHPGHLAGNFLPADIFSRFHRYLGNQVLMVLPPIVLYPSALRLSISMTAS